MLKQDYSDQLGKAIQAIQQIHNIAVGLDDAEYMLGQVNAVLDGLNIDILQLIQHGRIFECRKEEVKDRIIVPEKTLEEQRATIETFGFGLENYKIVKDSYVRK